MNPGVRDFFSHSVSLQHCIALRETAASPMGLQLRFFLFLSFSGPGFKQLKEKPRVANPPCPRNVSCKPHCFIATVIYVATVFTDET